MIPSHGRALALVLLLSPFAVWADGVSVVSSGLFPTDRLTARDWSNATFRRVALPKPDCAVRPSDCADIDVLNTLDGFSTQPRITVPFTGDIDIATVTSETVFLLNLGDTLSLKGFGRKVGINQVVWNPATKTLSFESDELLAEHSRYLLVVTDGVRDAAGKPIQRFEDDDRSEHARDLRDARRALSGTRHRIAAATLFTTQSISADLSKINRQIKASNPAPVDFMVGGVRALFPTATLQGIQFARQTGTTAFTTSFLATPALGVVPGAVGAIAYGRFASPDYQDAGKVIPASGTLTGAPKPLGSNTLTVQVFLPAGPKPAGGWPVAIFGHGFTDSMYGAPWAVASVFASRGLATVSINVVGHGGGEKGTLTVLQAGQAPVVVPAGGRGIDQDGNGTIDSTEGVNAAPPRTLLGSRDGLRQTVVDLMQLVRQIEAGVDIDGDGAPDLDASRITYAGQSFGGIYGTIFLGVEPGLKAGMPNVPGGSITEVARLGAFRPLTGIALATRVPSLINVADPSGIAFNENLPLRNEPARIDTVAGAAEIQKVLDRFEWAQQAGNPVSYAAAIRAPVIVQFAKGDFTVPNPTTSAILRAGGLADRAVLFRNDLAFAANPAVPKNPHTFLTNIASAAAAPYAVAAQTQMAVFLASLGAQLVDPDGAGPFFEVPLVGAPPETLSFQP